MASTFDKLFDIFYARCWKILVWAPALFVLGIGGFALYYALNSGTLDGTKPKEISGTLDSFEHKTYRVGSFTKGGQSHMNAFKVTLQNQVYTISDLVFDDFDKEAFERNERSGNSITLEYIEKGDIGGGGRNIVAMRSPNGIYLSAKEALKAERFNSLLALIIGALCIPLGIWTALWTLKGVRSNRWAPN